MAETASLGNMKEKISAVRSAVHNKSNNEIVLVLQQFDNNVDKTVQAFVDGSAIAVLREWSMPGKKKINKRKRSKSKPNPNDKGIGEDEATERPQGVCGYHMNGFDKDNLPSDAANEKIDPVLQEDKGDTPEESLHAHLPIPESSPQWNGLSRCSEPQPRTGVHRSEFSIPSAQDESSRSWPKKTADSKSHAPSGHSEPLPDESNKKRGANVEKSVKDLQRCTVTLGRYRMMLKEEMDGSVKKIKATFAELQSCIIDREVALMSEVDKVKQEAMDILNARQKKAEELKRMADLANRMSDTQLSELRAEIKHFVSERKYDEELGRSARFSGDIEHLKTQILHCGEISHPKNSYSLRTSASSAMSSEDAPVGNQTSSRQNPSARLKAWDRKINIKPANPTEFSLPAASTIKQNGSANSRRRYNPRSQSLRTNGIPVHAHSHTDEIPKSISGMENPLPTHNGFRNRSKGAGRTEDPQNVQRPGTRPAFSLSPVREKQPELDTRFLHGSVTGVSHCQLHSNRMETMADAEGRSVRTVKLVA